MRALFENQVREILSWLDHFLDEALLRAPESQLVGSFTKFSPGYHFIWSNMFLRRILSSLVVFVVHLMLSRDSRTITKVTTDIVSLSQQDLSIFKTRESPVPLPTFRK